MDGSDYDEMTRLADMMPCREWLAIERAALLEDAGDFAGPAEVTRYAGGYANLATHFDEETPFAGDLLEAA